MTFESFDKRFEAKNFFRPSHFSFLFFICSEAQRLKSYGKDDIYLIMVVGPFAYLSDDFMVLFDFLGRVRTTQSTLQLQYEMSTKTCTGDEPPYFGFSFWSRGCFGVGSTDSRPLPDFQPLSSSGAFVNSFSSDPRRGGYRGRYVPGA